MWLDRFSEEHDNLRAALGWFVRQGEAERSLRLCGAIWHFWYDRSLLTEGRRWLEAALALPAPSSAAQRALALRGSYAFAVAQGDLEPAVRYGEASLALYREIADIEGISSMCGNLAWDRQREGDIEGALSYLEENEALARQSANPGLLAQALYGRGLLLHEQGNGDEAVRFWEEGIALQCREGLTLNLANILGALADHQREHGRYERAAALIEEALVVADHRGNLEELADVYSHRSMLRVSQGDLDGARKDLEASFVMAQKWGSIWSMLNALGNALTITTTEGHAVKAARIHGAQESAYERMGMPIPAEARKRDEPYVAAARTQLGEVSFQAARHDGQAMSLDDAIAYALKESD